MANCNNVSCKPLLKALFQANVGVQLRKKRLNGILALMGFTGAFTVTVIGIWLAEVGLAAATVSTIPGLGWVLGGATAVFLVASGLQFSFYKRELNYRNDLCKEAYEACEVECLPGYCR